MVDARCACNLSNTERARRLLSRKSPRRVEQCAPRIARCGNVELGATRCGVKDAAAI